MARVLPIDDDRENVDFMRQMLHIDGHDMAWAADSEQGLAQIRQSPPQLVLCGNIMLHPGGYAVLETLRADPRFSRIPVLLFSAAMSDAARAIALRRGANEVLAKPFELAQLRSAIGRYLGQDRQ